MAMYIPPPPPPPRPMPAERARDAAALLRGVADYHAVAAKACARPDGDVASMHRDYATRLRALAETLGRVTGEMAEAVESCVTDAGLYLDNHLGGRSPRDTAQLDRASAAADLLAALAGGTEGR